MNELVWLHEAIQEKLKTASYSEQIQVFSLVPDKWSRMYCWEYLNVFEYLVWTSNEIKKVGGILAKHAPKKEKLPPLKHFILKQTFMKMTISVDRCLKRKTVSVSKRVHKQKLRNLQESYTAFKEKHPNINIGFSKYCTLRPKGCVLPGSKMTHSVCLCSAHQNVVLPVHAMDWDLT